MSQTNEAPDLQNAPTETDKPPSSEQPSRRWAALVGAFILGILYALLPGYVTVGPGWLPLVIEIVLLVPLVLYVFIRRPQPVPERHVRIVFFTVLGVVTLALAIGVGLMIATLPGRTTAQSVDLLRTGALLWLSNILVFALWYWEIDGSGPHKRFKAGHQAADLMFPQQVDGNTRGWAPHFVDYLFVAFTGATAFSPTDTYPLTPKAKLLMMAEAIIALVISVILVGRAINILGK